MRDTEGQEPATDVRQPRTPRLNRRVAMGGLALGVVGIGGIVGAKREWGSASPPGRIPITVWSWQTQPEVQALADVAAAFNASQDEIDVQVVPRPGAYSTFQLLNTIRNGLGPDVAVGSRALLAERDALGVCDDLAPYLANANPAIDLDRDFLPFAAQEVRIGERVVGIPLETTVRVLAFNRSILSAAGLDLTEWDLARGPVTFARLAEVAQGLDLTNADGTYARIGFVPSFGEGTPYQYLSAWGATYFDDGQCAFTVDTPEAEAAVGWVRSYGQHIDGPQLDEFLTRHGGVSVPAGAPFAEGAIVFALVRGEDLRAIAQLKPGFEVGATFVPIPEVSAQSRSWATGNALSLMTGTKHPEEAARFVAYMASAEVLDRYCLAIGSLPSRMQPSPEVLQGLALPPFVTDQVLATAVGSPHVPIASQFQDQLFGAWGDMVAGQVEIAAGLSDLQEQGDQDLSDAGVTCP